jgi:hypothetical protein
MVVAVVLLATLPAMAKDKDKGKGGGKNDSGIELTGIDSIDEVFKQVRDIDKRLTKVDNQLAAGKTNLNTALGLKKGTPISDGIKELNRVAGNKLQLGMSGNVPKLQVSDAVPSNVQEAVDAVNAMTTNFPGAIQDLAGMAPEIDRLIKASTKMPNKLKEEFSKGGIGFFEKLFKLPKITKALTNDVKVTAGLPERTASVTKRMTDVLSTVQNEFGPGGGRGGGGNAGGGDGRGGGGKDGGKGGKAGKGGKKGKKN